MHTFVQESLEMETKSTYTRSIGPMQFLHLPLYPTHLDRFFDFIHNIYPDIFYIHDQVTELVSNIIIILISILINNVFVFLKFQLKHCLEEQGAPLEHGLIKKTMTVSIL